MRWAGSEATAGGVERERPRGVLQQKSKGEVAWCLATKNKGEVPYNERTTAHRTHHFFFFYYIVLYNRLGITAMVDWALKINSLVSMCFCNACVDEALFM